MFGMLNNKEKNELRNFLLTKYPPIVEQRLNGVYSQPNWWKKHAKLEYYEFLSFLRKEKNLENFQEAVYLFLKNLEEPPLCLCGRKRKFISILEGYAEVCNNRSCSFYREAVAQKRKQTCLQKYGVENISQSSLVKEKKKQTFLRKYGCYYFQSEEFKQRVKQKWLQKYGVDNPFKTEEVKQKIKQVLLEKYGGMGFGSSVLKQKIQQTCLEKYGSSTIGNVPEIVEKRINTCLKKYGTKSPACSDKVKAKLRETCRKKYGVEWTAQKHIKHFENYNLNFVLKHFVDENGLFEIKKASEYFNVSYNVWYQNSEFAGKLPPAKKEFGEFENEIVEYLKSLDSSLYVERNVKGILNNPNFELDIFLPDYRIAIEFDGLMWHSFGMSEVSTFNNYMYESEQKYKHLEKTRQCKKQGIRLFHVFENEWILKQNIWKSILANVLNKNIRRIYARDCGIKEVSSEEAQKFLNENHLQGYIPAKINLGLFLGNELVSLVSFGKPRFNKNYEWELFRFCNKLFTSVVGGFSKLFTYFVEHHKPKSVITYVDRRYGIGSVYERAGFIFLKETEPDYFYFKKGTLELYHRTSFQKHLLREKLEYFDETKTETENMYLNGYRKIYDCGNLVYTWKGGNHDYNKNLGYNK